MAPVNRREDLGGLGWRVGRMQDEIDKSVARSLHVAAGGRHSGEEP
ncbi:hypothetical protein ACPW96_22700 [Micromonospora sp. DT81.3]